MLLILVSFIIGFVFERSLLCRAFIEALWPGRTREPSVKASIQAEPGSPQAKDHAVNPVFCRFCQFSAKGESNIFPQIWLLKYAQVEPDLCLQARPRPSLCLFSKKSFNYKGGSL